MNKVMASPVSTLPPGWSVPPEETWLPRARKPLLPPGEGNAHDVVPLVWLVAAHGGAGVSTLCQWWDFVGDATRQWPECDSYPVALVVAKATMEGLSAADTQVRSAVAGATSCLLLGVVVVETLPRLPRRVSHRLTSLEATVEYAGGHMWRIPYYAGIIEVMIADLPTWSLDEEPVEQGSRHRPRRGDVASQVPQVVRDVGRLIAQEAIRLLRDKP